MAVAAMAAAAANTTIDPAPDIRLLLVSSRTRNKKAIFLSVLPSVKTIQYNYETTTLDDLSSMIVGTLGGIKVSSIAMILHTSERELFVCAPGEARISLRTLITEDPVKAFFQVRSER